jgi:small subunit ribosomal protein S5
MSEKKQFGRRGGGRKPRDFDQTLVDVARVARVVKGRKRFRFRGTIVIGDHKGKVGMGVAKGPDVTTAIAKAVAQAKKNFVHVPLVNETIPHEIEYKYSSATVLLKPARPGTGIIAGGGVRAVAELAGIKNLLSKMLGSANKINNIRAALSGLASLRLPQAVATTRGKKLSDLGLREAMIDRPLPKTVAPDKAAKLSVKKSSKL